MRSLLVRNDKFSPNVPYDVCVALHRDQQLTNISVCSCVGAPIHFEGIRDQITSRVRCLWWSRLESNPRGPNLVVARLAHSMMMLPQ